MENKLNVQKLGYEVGEPMWVHWDDRYVWRGGHILGECPDENLITTVGYLAYMDAALEYYIREGLGYIPS